VNDAAVFEATVPVFKHYLQCVEMLLTKLSDDHVPLLQEGLTTHAFTASEHLHTAIGFVTRTVFPLQGLEAYDSEDETLGRDDLVRLATETRTLLLNLTPADFDGASSRVILHTAGTAKLNQSATTFATVLGLPNFFFHLSMAFAILRHGGVEIGKGDFDGQHLYPANFHF